MSRPRLPVKPPGLPLRLLFGLLGVLLLRAAPLHAAPDVSELLRRGLHEVEAWNPEGASEVLDEMVARFPGEPQTAFLRGRVLFEQGSYEAAAKALEQAQEAELGDVEGSVAQHLRLAKAAAEEVRGAQVVESAHFAFFAKAEKDRLLAPFALEALEKAYAALTADLGYRPPGKVRVEIYDSAQALARVSPLTVADIKGSGTIALCKYNRLMVTSPRALLRGYPWLDTVSHEFVHYLVTRKGHNTVPIWLQEGLAKFLETRWRGQPGRSIDEFQQQLLLKAAKAKELIPFSAMHPSIAKLPTQEKAALAFAEVEAAIRLLYERGGQGALTELVAAMAAGMSDEQAVAQAFGKSFHDFEADWRADVARPRTGPEVAARSRRPRKLVFREDAKAPREKDPSAQDGGELSEPKDPEARRASRLGELLFARGRWEGAAHEYGRARGLLHEEDPVLDRRYAFSLAQLGRFGEADQALRAALQRDPQDSSAAVLHAEVLLRLGDRQRMRGALDAAVAVDPFDPRLHQAWYALAEAEHDAATLEREKAALALLYGRKQERKESTP